MVKRIVVVLAFLPMAAFTLLWIPVIYVLAGKVPMETPLNKLLDWGGE